MTVTFFGHRDAPTKIKEPLRVAIVNLIENENATTFYVGNNGSFDLMAQSILRQLKKVCPIKYYVVLAYPPRKTDKIEYNNETIYPEGLESVPQRYAIPKRNDWMLKKSDTVITYVTHPSSGACVFERKAEEKGKKVVKLYTQTEL